MAAREQHDQLASHHNCIKSMSSKTFTLASAAADSCGELLQQYAPIDRAGTGAPTEKLEAEVHVVMVPYPLQGHLNPMLQFAKTLVSKHGVSVTFVTNKHIHDRTLAAAHSDTPEKLTQHGHMISSSKLQLLWLDNGLPPDFDYLDLSPDRLRELEIANSTIKEPFKQLLDSLNQKCPHVSCVLFESFCPWAHSVATELGIPSVFFWTQSTSVFSMYYHTPLLAANGFFPYDKKSLRGRIEVDGAEPHKAGDHVMVSYVPGVPALPPSSFPTLLHIDDLSDESFACIRNSFSILNECKGVIINSFEELEKEACQAVRAELAFPVHLVGPLIPFAFLDGSDNNDTTVRASFLEDTNECINWLDGQKKHSVLYVSFGTICSPSSKDIEAIACGIKASKQPFLWVIRPTSSAEHVCDSLPKDFIEETKEYGLIIPWAPQIRVLSHPSIGAFLTHCGWNSTLESLSMGMPLITFPIFSDQPTNCTYICDFWKVGMALKRHGDGIAKSEDVERVVRTVLHEEEGKEMRRRARRLKEAARQAVIIKGSSSIDIESFIQGIKTQAM